METLFFTFLGLLMVSMVYVGTHMNTPMFWEEDGLIDKIKDKVLDVIKKIAKESEDV